MGSCFKTSAGVSEFERRILNKNFECNNPKEQIEQVRLLLLQKC
jgi:hypothetical protein